MAAEGATGAGRVRIVTALLLVAIFAAGVVAGAAVCRWAAPKSPPGPPPGPPMPLPWRELGLAPAQEEKARVIVDRYRPQLEAVVKETFPRIRALSDRMESDLREILSPEQRARLDELKARRPPPGPPPPGAPPPPPGGPAPPGFGPPPPPAPFP